MPGRHVTDQQMRLFMTHRQTHTVSVAAAKAGIIPKGAVSDSFVLSGIPLASLI